jgi:hypothetical protein
LRRRISSWIRPSPSWTSELPQPADLPDPGGAEEADAAVSLQPQARRHAVPRQRGDDRRATGPVHPARRQIAALPAERVRGAPSRSNSPRPSARPVRHRPPRRVRRPKPPASLQSLADQLILQRYAPPAVLVNDKGDILYISGRTGKYLEPAAGKANWNIFAMAREGLRYELADAFQKRSGKKARDAPRAQGGDQWRHAVRGRHRPAARGTRAAAGAGDDRVHRRGRARGPRRRKRAPKAPPTARGWRNWSRNSSRSAPRRGPPEEMQTSQEELRSANEELQSTNEELQSTNEELTTSKEEMQSMNEELQTSTPSCRPRWTSCRGPATT